MMKRQEWLLLVIAESGVSGLTPIQLQKTLFLIGQSYKLKNNYYNFIPYNYGPFDPQISKDAEKIATTEEIIIFRNGNPYPKYFITPLGQVKADNLKRKYKKEAKFVKKLVDFIKSLTFRNLLRVIYKNYPLFAVNSIFRK